MGIAAFTWTSGVTMLALIVYFWTIIRVGQARMKYKIDAPATTGTPEFERAFRIQQNTLEQLVFFVPALWLFAALHSDVWAAGLGAAWIVGRILYVLGYASDAKKRGTGFMIAGLAALALLVGALVGWFMKM